MFNRYFSVDINKKRLKVIESELLDSESPNKKAKTSEEMNATQRILIIPLDIEDDDSQETTICVMSNCSIENSIRQSHRTHSKLALNEKTNIECDKNSSDSSPNQFYENIRDISASDYGYISDFDEEHCFLVEVIMALNIIYGTTILKLYITIISKIMCPIVWVKKSHNTGNLSPKNTLNRKVKNKLFL